MAMKKTEQTDAVWLSLQSAHARTTFSVSELRRLCITGEVEAVHIIKPGKERGHRLIKASSLDAYIASFMPGGSRYNQGKQLENVGK
jgi:hypothetical protein